MEQNSCKQMDKKSRFGNRTRIGRNYATSRSSSTENPQNRRGWKILHLYYAQLQLGSTFSRREGRWISCYLCCLRRWLLWYIRWWSSYYDLRRATYPEFISRSRFSCDLTELFQRKRWMNAANFAGLGIGLLRNWYATTTVSFPDNLWLTI